MEEEERSGLDENRGRGAMNDVRKREREDENRDELRSSAKRYFKKVKEKSSI